jgi:hypothetical protein
MQGTLRTLLLTGIVFAALYGSSLALYEAFPYVGEGARLIYERKLEFIEQNSIFPSDDGRKVAVFGNSKVLSGFVPDIFDSLAPGEAFSYNLGLPDADRFIPALEKLIDSGNLPTDIIITMPWMEPPPQNPLVFIDDDKKLIQELVPFRRFPRDLAIFFYRSRYRGGIQALYEETKILSDKVLIDRGYHFVAGQSLYPNSKLPDDYTLNSDQPEKFFVRDFSFDGSAFQRLSRILEDNRIRAFIVPTYHRIHEYRSDPGPNLELRRGVADSTHIWVLGNDYLSLPNHLFSDPVHVNREGAVHYTKVISDLIEPFVGNNEIP